MAWWVLAMVISPCARDASIRGATRRPVSGTKKTLVEPRHDGLRRARRLMEQIGQVLAQLALAERRGDDEIGRAALAVRAEQERRPIAWRPLDDDEATENVEAILRHSYTRPKTGPSPSLWH